MGYNFEGTLHSILNKTELNGKWELTYDGKLVITRVNAQFIEDLKFFHELSNHTKQPFDKLVEMFIARREELIDDVA